MHNLPSSFICLPQTETFISDMQHLNLRSTAPQHLSSDIGVTASHLGQQYPPHRQNTRIRRSCPELPRNSGSVKGYCELIKKGSSSLHQERTQFKNVTIVTSTSVHKIISNTRSTGVQLETSAGAFYTSNQTMLCARLPSTLYFPYLRDQPSQHNTPLVLDLPNVCCLYIGS